MMAERGVWGCVLQVQVIDRAEACACHGQVPRDTTLFMPPALPPKSIV
jgi:hypothetical protein